MAVKTRLPKMVNDSDSVTLQRVMYETVYRNAGDPNIYLMQSEWGGVFLIVRPHDSFVSFQNPSDALEYLREDDVPDLWNETDLIFVASIEAK